MDCAHIFNNLDHVHDVIQKVNQLFIKKKYISFFTAKQLHNIVSHSSQNIFMLNCLIWIESEFLTTLRALMPDHFVNISLALLLVLQCSHTVTQT